LTGYVTLAPDATVWGDVGVTVVMFTPAFAFTVSVCVGVAVSPVAVPVTATVPPVDVLATNVKETELDPAGIITDRGAVVNVTPVFT
jgi:hypothetical protein